MLNLVISSRVDKGYVCARTFWYQYASPVRGNQLNQSAKPVRTLPKMQKNSRIVNSFVNAMDSCSGTALQTGLDTPLIFYMLCWCLVQDTIAVSRPH